MSNLLHYKGYIGTVQFSEPDAVFHGKVIGIKSMLTFEGDCVASLIKGFHDAVDEYLELCEASGKQAEKPFKGTFNVRISSDLHRKAYETALSQGKSLNSFVEECIKRAAV